MGRWYSGVTATPAEQSLMDNVWNSIVTVTVDGEDGTATAQFTFKDVAGVTMATPVCGSFYLSETSTGLLRQPADTSIVVLTNGSIVTMDAATNNGWKFTTTAAGLLGMTITASADDYWIVFEHPTGKLVISDQITITAGG